MLLCNINFYKSIPNKFDSCINFINNFKINPLPPGRYDLNGDGFVNVCEYETTDEENCIKEAHKKYIDVHYMVSGAELAKQAFIDEVAVNFYKEDDDYVAVTGNFNRSFVLKEGDVFIAYPEDAHLTRISVASAEKVKKLIFKIPV